MLRYSKGIHMNLVIETTISELTGKSSVFYGHKPVSALFVEFSPAGIVSSSINHKVAINCIVLEPFWRR